MAHRPTEEELLKNLQSIEAKLNFEDNPGGYIRYWCDRIFLERLISLKEKEGK